MCHSHARSFGCKIIAVILLTETDTTPITIGLAAFIGGIGVAVATGILWFKNEMSKLRNEFFRIVSRHNREDDENFGVLEDGIWNVIARNSQKDSTPTPPRQSLRRRRYLMDDGVEQEHE